MKHHNQVIIKVNMIKRLQVYTMSSISCVFVAGHFTSGGVSVADPARPKHPVVAVMGQHLASTSSPSGPQPPFSSALTNCHHHHQQSCHFLPSSLLLWLDTSRTSLPAEAVTALVGSIYANVIGLYHFQSFSLFR